MKFTTVFFPIAIILLSGTMVQAQDSTHKVKRKETGPHAMNLIKTNLTSIPLKTYSIQYERVLRKKMSVSLSLRTMPSANLPFKSTILNIAGGDQNTKDIIQNTMLSNFAVTPELRFYLGKGYGRGFYIALFYRYASFTTSQVPENYNDILNNQETINLSGKVTANTGGVMFGVQWLLGKHLCLDWWILGAHYGSGQGNFVGVPGQPLTPSEQDEIRKDLENVDIPLTNKTVTVTANNVTVKLDGPWGGIRSGLSFGFRF